MKCHSRNTFILRSHFHHTAFAERLTPSSAHYVFQYLRHAYSDVADLVPPKAKIVRPNRRDSPDEEKVESRVHNNHFLGKKCQRMQCRVEYAPLATNWTQPKQLWYTWKVEPTAFMHRPCSHWCMRTLSMNVSSFQVLFFFFLQMGKCARNSPRQHKTE